MRIKWFNELRGLFATERPRTVIKIEGNKLKCAWLDEKQQVLKRYEVKFKHSNKLKKFWEGFILGKAINYYAQEQVYWSTDLLRIKR